MIHCARRVLLYIAIKAMDLALWLERKSDALNDEQKEFRWKK